MTRFRYELTQRTFKDRLHSLGEQFAKQAWKVYSGHSNTGHPLDIQTMTITITVTPDMKAMDLPDLRTAVIDLLDYNLKNLTIWNDFKGQSEENKS